MSEPARWQQRVEEFVLGQIGVPPARVLEVGCEEGELARAMVRAGHSVTAMSSWLQRRCWGWARGNQGGIRVPAEAHFAGWAREEGFHSARADAWRTRTPLHRTPLCVGVPYLYPDLDDDTSEADESAAIEAGAIDATGFRYVGTLALEEEHFQAR